MPKNNRFEASGAILLALFLPLMVSSCKSEVHKSEFSNVVNQLNAESHEKEKKKTVEIDYLSRNVDVNRKEGLEALKAHDLDKAERCYIAAMQQIDLYPKEEARKAQINHDLACVYEEREMYAEAVPLMNKAQKLFIRAYGRESPLVALTMSDLGRILVKQQRSEEASFVYKTAADLMEKSARANPAKFKESYKEMCAAHLKCLRVAGRGLKVPVAESRLKDADKL